MNLGLDRTRQLPYYRSKSCPATIDSKEVKDEDIPEVEEASSCG